MENIWRLHGEYGVDAHRGNVNGDGVVGQCLFFRGIQQMDAKIPSLNSKNSNSLQLIY